MAGLIQRGSIYYAVYYIGEKQKRRSLQTDCLQIAKEKLRDLEKSIFRGNTHHFPTQTPIGDVVTSYIESMGAKKTAKSVKRDVSYLRTAFGPIRPALALDTPKKKKLSEKRKRTPLAPVYIEASCFEQITTADVANFISTQVRRKGLAPKTANRHREILTRLFNWSMKEGGVKMPEDRNPAAQVERYREGAPIISFLTLKEIDEQLEALADFPDLQAEVAVYIYAGLRREELCWLQVDDVDLTAGGYGVLRIRAKTVDGEFWESKTKTNRVVPISSTLRRHLDRYTPPDVAGGWFFSTPTGCRWDPDNLSGELSSANEKAGLDWTCLDFRHTFGSQLAMKGESLYKISKLMGNSPEICRRHYAALLPESLIASVEFGAVTPPAAPEPLPPAPAPVGHSKMQGPRLRLVVNNL